MVEAICEVVRDVIDVNDVDVVLVAQERSSVGSTTTVAVPRRSGSTPTAQWAAREPSSRRRLGIDTPLVLANVERGATDLFPVAPLTSRRVGTPASVVFVYGVDALASGPSPPRRLHVRYVKCQEPRGLTTSTSHNSWKGSLATLPGPACSALFWRPAGARQRGRMKPASVLARVLNDYAEDCGPERGDCPTGPVRAVRQFP